MTFSNTPQIFRSLADILNRSPRLFIWLSVLTALMLLACFSLLASILLTPEIFEFSIKIPWENLIGAYLFLVVSGSGLCIISALGSVFGMRRYEMMTRRMVFLSFISVFFGLACILFHLGHPERVPIYNTISPNFRSAISWMGLLYNIYLVLVAIEFWLLIRPQMIRRAEQYEGLVRKVVRLVALQNLDDRLSGTLLRDPGIFRLIGAAGLVIGVSALTMLGSVFAHTESRGLWYGPYYPVYFLVSALFCGYALLLAATIISYRVRRDEMLPEIRNLIFEMAQVLVVLLVIGFLLTAFRLLTGLFDKSMAGPVMLLLKGPFSLAFWIFEIGAMTVVPVFLLSVSARKRSLTGVLLGSVMVLLGAFVMRYVFVVAGQVYPNIKGGLPSYMPTVTELFLIGGIFGAFLMTYTLGEKFLPLKEERLQHGN